ncbi:MAG TPA: ATP-binding protein [Burkholderiales bacterium]
MRLRTGLILLVIATAVPLLAVALFASAMLVGHEESNFVTAVKDRNRAFMAAVDAELKGTIVTLKALSASRMLANDDLAGFHQTLVAALATQGSWINVVLLDPDGRQVINAAVPWGTPLPQYPTQPDSVREVVSTLRPAVGGLVVGGGFFTKRPSIPVRVPVVRGGHLVYILSAILDPEAFQTLIANQRLPEGWASGLADANGLLIARVPARTIGTQASPDYLAATRSAREGWYRGRTLDGTDTFTAHTASDLSGWTVGFAIPSELVLGGSRRAAWLMGAGVLLSLAAALGLALYLGRRIARPMNAIAAAAQTLGTSARPLEVKTRIREVAELAGALIDASNEIQRRDAELRQTAADLQRADANKSQFLALLSHELRNPLAPLLNGLTLLRMRHPQAGAETQQMMERQVGHLRRLIDDLLDVSRIDRGKLELRRARIAVDSVVRNAIDTAKPAIEAKSHALVVRYAPEALYVEGDPVRLSQVVANLLNNAAKFTAAGGRIEIVTRAEAGRAVVSVKDNGVGFAPADAKRMFEMFVQLDPGRQHGAGGLGLGLTLVRSLVEMHGGAIEAQSAGPGLGAEFVMRLPLAAAAAEDDTAPQAALRPAAPARGRVLVVDDNVDAADSLAQILRLEGFEVRAAYDGENALHAAAELRPDVAFLDLNMPGMSGYHLASRMRSQQWGRALRLVALTGMGQKADLAATRGAGFDAHLTKPAAAEDVLRLAAGAENVLAFGERRAS